MIKMGTAKNNTAVMGRAWAIYRLALAAEAGGVNRAQFRWALRMAWIEAKAAEVCSTRKDMSPSMGGVGALHHQYGALNDDCTVNRALIWLQSFRRAAAVYKGPVIVGGMTFGFRFLLTREIRAALSLLRHRVNRYRRDAEFNAAVEAGGVAKTRALIERSIEIAQFQKRPNRAAIAEMQAELSRNANA